MATWINLVGGLAITYNEKDKEFEIEVEYYDGYGKLPCIKRFFVSSDELENTLRMLRSLML